MQKTGDNVEHLLSGFKSPLEIIQLHFNCLYQKLPDEYLLRRDIHQQTIEEDVYNPYVTDLRTSVLERMMLTNIDGDKSPNFCGHFRNYMICNYFRDHAGLRNMLYIIK